MKFIFFHRHTTGGRSLPSRECGLKSDTEETDRKVRDVTPFAGVWIEIGMYSLVVSVYSVTPFAGVWIEIFRLR